MAHLVAIGDSLTQGFQSGAITHVDLSYPAIIARSMGLPPERFRVPDFQGEGGLPCNIEHLARTLSNKYGARINPFEWVSAPSEVHDFLDRVEDYWERGRGADPGFDTTYHNLAVWGFEVGDAYNIDAQYCHDRIGKADNFLAIPSEARLRTAYRVLNPAQISARMKDTQVSIARRIAQTEGIKHLIVWLGANNCLGSVLGLKVEETGPHAPGPQSGKTLWSASAFREEYEQLAAHLKDIGAQHTYLATVPHITIPPLTRGVMRGGGKLPLDRRYFDYYTYFFMRDEEFDPKLHDHLTREEAEMIDRRIDAYNAIIRELAQKNGWHLVDLCDVLDRLAVRRNHGIPSYPLPPALKGLSVRFFETDSQNKIKEGGLISLDGIHPTTCGYSIVAHEFIQAIRAADPQGPPIRDVDFAGWRRLDSLVRSPPASLDDIFGLLDLLANRFHLARWFI